MPQRSVLVVLFDDLQSLDVTGPVEVFSGAGQVRGEPYRIRTASVDGSAVRTSSGLTLVPDGSLADADDPHTLLVPGGRGTRHPDPRLTDWLREHAPRAERIVSVCTGALLLAAAGLLDGHRVTTHWSVCDHLSRSYPSVDVDPDPIFVRDGKLATSAGVTAGIDLALALVEEDHGRDTALTVARHLVVFLRRPGNQAQFSAQLAAQTARSEPLREVQQWISEHPGGDLSVESLAARARLSPRHFARAFHAETGTTPGRYVERVRLEQARRLLEDTAAGVTEISRACGYGTPEAMRRAFVRALATAPAEYRRRFRAAPSGSTPPVVPCPVG
ncbi:GlxA family transcriptional regulator [Streptomyces sp. NBC_01387]|uniref:GlxA family transcriptional regulator n=1 Tax=unclassified Streptomyces TaxID=2593676 RepID=UPI0020255FFE|nr:MULTISPECIES: GlxA family transcriptional regulator [unclassified Streptomyces]MCX4553788.1 GlxA family transcriptional regulator [Streptomyces sp. NBC_01500]WSC18703.1 GlxA family transcriptional regulator [Streptomyces sp. NBC_01766]WSV52737.1 GlxA family transcriptional regulator [Streptomyces sp. NBC_01014]